jgi:hypothetical protein
MKELTLYKESQFNKKDYRILYSISQSYNIKFKLSTSQYRDKKIQRQLSEKELIVFSCPLNELALHINTANESVKDIVKWRLHINK